MRSVSGEKNSQQQAAQLERDIQMLTREIEQFRIESLRYFGGDLKIPPEELRMQLVAKFRQIRQGGVKGVAENFRVNSLEARFNSQVDLYNRKMREREYGGPKTSAKPKAAPDPAKGVLVGRNGDANAVELLYKGLYLTGGSRNPGMDLEKFRSYIDRQAAVVRSKTGCEDIQFRIAVEDGKMKIKAKPVKS